MSIGDKFNSNLDVKKIKDSVNGKSYIESRLGHELKTTKRYRCPFCHANCSFAYYCKDGDKFKCHACGWHGDFIAFEQKLSNVDLPQALNIITQNTGTSHSFSDSSVFTSYAKSLKPKPEPLRKKMPQAEPKSHAPTFTQIKQQIEVTNYTDISSDLETWLTDRDFGRFAARGAEIAAKAGIRIVKIFDGKITNLAFPAKNAKGEIVGYQRAEYPAGKLYKGWYAGSDTKSVFVIAQNSDVVFMVEAVANAQALACAAYSVVALFGTSGVSNIPIVKAMFPGKRLVLWLDAGVEDIQRKAMQDHSVDGIFWQESFKKGYDQNDLLSERQKDFPQIVENYLAQLPNRSKLKIAEAFANWVDAKMIVAAPGSGKTHQTLEKLLEAIALGTPFLYVANNTKDLGDFEKELRKKTKADVLLLQGGRKIIDDDLVTTNSSGKKLSHYKWIITHKTFLQRKGLGSKFYNLINWIITQKPFVVIDESNEFLKSLKKLVALSVMSLGAKRKGKKETYVTVYHENPDYKSQAYKLHLYEPSYNLRFDVDKYGNSNLVIASGDLDQQKQMRLCFEMGSKTDLSEVNYSVNLIKQKPGYLEKKLQDAHISTHYEDNELFDRNDLQDIIECSLNPAIVEVYATLSGQRFKHYDGIDEATKAKVKQPSRAFGEYLRLFDLLPLAIIAKYARGVRFLCTTENSELVSILKHVLPKIDVVHTQRQAEKLDGVMVIGFSKECHIAKITEKIKDIKTLIFAPNDKAVDSKFAKTPNDIAIGKVKESEVEPKRKFTDKELFFMLANPFGTIGKAVNLPEYAASFADGDLHEPFIANTELPTKQAILDHIQRNRIELLWQSNARILRGKGRKVVVFFNVTSEDFQQILGSVSLGEIAKEHHTKFISHDESLAYELVNAYIKEGKFADREETQPETTQNRLSQKQRIAKKEEFSEVAIQKEKEKMKRLENEIIKAAKEGINWHDVMAKYNLHRLNSDQKEKLRFFYKASLTKN